MDKDVSSIFDSVHFLEVHCKQMTSVDAFLELMNQIRLTHPQTRQLTTMPRKVPQKNQVTRFAFCNSC